MTKTSKRLLALVMSVIMLASMGINALAAAFSDVDDSHWAYEYVQDVSAKEIFNGVGGDSFDPDGEFTRGMMVTALGRMVGVDPAVYRGKATFTDVDKGEYYHAYIEWAAANNIVTGYGGDLFGPEDPIIRQDLSTLIYNFAEYIGYSFIKVNAPEEFKDAADIADYALGPVSVMQQAGLLEGNGTGYFDPRGTADRAGAAKLCSMLSELAEAEIEKLKNPDSGNQGSGDVYYPVEPPMEEVTYTAANYPLCYVQSVNAADKTARVYVDGVPGDYTVANYNADYAYGGVMTYEITSAGELRLYDQVKPNKTVRWLETADEANTLTEAIENLGFGYSGTNAKNWSYGSIADRLQFEQGMYVNGNKTVLAEGVKYYAIKGDGTLEVLDGPKDAYVTAITKAAALEVYADIFGTANGSADGYKYAAAAYNDKGELTALYYTGEGLGTYSTANVTIRDFDLHNPAITGADANYTISGQTGRAQMDPTAERFISAEIYVDGAANTYEPIDFSGTKLTLSNEKTDEEASIIYAKNKGVIQIGAFDFEHYSRSNWAKIAFENQTDGASTEVSMQYGLNAVLYAMGGSIHAGDDNVRSSVFAAGDNANGIFAGTTGGTRTAGEDPTATVTVKNADFRVIGWNNHVADVVYGGYVYLDGVNGVTGIPGRSAVGQSTPLANDFGSGVVEAYNCKFQAWAARSAGIYAIGTGKIMLGDSEVDTYQAGALVSSGGQFWVYNTKAYGPMAVRVRGGGTSNYPLYIENSELITEMRLEGTSIDVISGEPVNYEFYGSHNMTNAEIAAYASNHDENGVAVGQYFWDMSDVDSVLAGTEYSNKAAYLAGTKYDNLFYNYSTCAYGAKDYVDVPYLTPGTFNGLVGSVINFDNETQHLVATNNTYENKNTDGYGDDYNYLLSAENGGGARVDFIDHDETLEGLIWNQGVKTTETSNTRKGTSTIEVNFHNSDFTGSFADGYNGLWEGDVWYYDCKGNLTNLNGNYWAGEANWGIKAAFDSQSTWTVTHDSYLGQLTLVDASCIQAPAGKELVMYVDGVKADIKAGTYVGHIVIMVVDTDNDTADYTITVNTAEGGTVTAPATAKYRDGVRLTVSADADYDIKSVTVKTASGKTVAVDTDTMTFIMPKENVTVTPVFADYYDESVWSGQYKVQIVTEGSGSAEAYSYTAPSGPNKASLGALIRRSNAGTNNKSNVAIVASPAAGYKIASMTYTDAGGEAKAVTAPDGNKANYYNFVMPAADTTVTVTFERDITDGKAKIGASVFEYLGETGGTIKCGDETAANGLISVPATGEFTLTFEPKAGYGVLMVIKDGEYNQGSGVSGTVLGAPASVTFSSIDEVESIQVIFAQIAQESAFTFASGTITGYTGPGSYPFVLYPKTIGGTAVAAMGQNASYRCEGLIYTIPEGVTTIGSAAFGDLVECQCFIMPTTLTDVAEDWLAGGTGATFYFPEAVYDRYDFLQSNSKVIAY